MIKYIEKGRFQTSKTELWATVQNKQSEWNELDITVSVDYVTAFRR